MSDWSLAPDISDMSDDELWQSLSYEQIQNIFNRAVILFYENGVETFTVRAEHKDGNTWKFEVTIEGNKEE